MTCLLKNGCPCKADCPRHGKCAECIAHHYDESAFPTTCMSEKMKALMKENEK